MAQKLFDKVAVVTGANSGIGLAAAKQFAHEGARVFITGRRKPELDAAVATIGRGATGIQADSSNLSDLDALFETIKSEAGRIDFCLSTPAAAHCCLSVTSLSNSMKTRSAAT